MCSCIEKLERYLKSESDVIKKLTSCLSDEIAHLIHIHKHDELFGIQKISAAINTTFGIIHSFTSYSSMYKREFYFTLSPEVFVMLSNMCKHVFGDRIKDVLKHDAIMYTRLSEILHEKMYY
jgi:hypothetical protein